MGGSQLKQLKAAISTSGVTISGAGSRKRKRGSSDGGAVSTHRDKRAEKLKEIHQKFNTFDIKVEKLKHDVGGRKIKGILGRPGASKQAGIEQRKKTLLVEYEAKDKVGGMVDRRFGENDPTMSLEERMLARFAKEHQKASKGAMYNLEDEDELTHFGQSLSKLDDFDNAGLALDDEEQDDLGHIDADTVKTTHFKGFSDDEEEEEDDGPPRKKSKAEVMAEVIAKSKEHKYARQLQHEQDEGIRHALDDDFNAIRGILFNQTSAEAPPSPILPTSKPSEPLAQTAKDDKDRDYDMFVRELAMEKRAQPKDRTKTEEEIALEEREALIVAEKRRLRRMMGEKEDSDDEGRQRDRGADDLGDDFILDEEAIGLGAGLRNAEEQPVDSSEGEREDDKDGSESEDKEEGSESDEDSQKYGYSDEGEEAEEGDIEELVSQNTKKRRSASSSTAKKGELPFTFPCPTTHDEFLDILDGVEDVLVGTVIERIRKLHHPSLHVDNKIKLQGFIGVLLDHILYSAARSPPALSTIDILVPHIFSLSKSYPISSAEFFVEKLNLLQKNLTRGLQDPLDSSSKTFPGAPELILLRVLGSIWSTSDMKHVVVGPAKILISAYLSLGRVRNLKDLASGLYLCSLVLHYEEMSKRFVPEAINFLVQAILLLCPSSYSKSSTLPSTFFLPDLDIIDSSLQIRPKKAGVLEPKGPSLFDILSCDEKGEQEKIDLIYVALELLGRYADMYKPLDGFIEIFGPILSILPNLTTKRLSSVFQEHISKLTGKLTKLLKFAGQTRKPLFLQAHKPIPIATYIPKFDAHNSSYIRNRDPDAERAALAKLKAQHRKEKKGAMRELRKDNRFLAGVQQERQEAKDREYKARMAKAFAGLEIERAEQKREEKAKRREKRRAGRK